MIIEDGTGNGRCVRVDDDNRLHVKALRLPEGLDAVVRANLFHVTTGIINLTSATESALLYLKSTDTQSPLVIARVTVTSGLSTGGTNALRYRVVRNPTAGTLISGGSALTFVNQNFSSSLVPSATALKGAQGSTVTDGVNLEDRQMALNAVDSDDSPLWLLNNGNTVAFALTPPTGNTSLNVSICVRCYSLNLAVF